MKKYFIDLESEEIEEINGTITFDTVEELLLILRIIIEAQLDTTLLKVEDFGVEYI